jgi:hypothetical protein
MRCAKPNWTSPAPIFGESCQPSIARVPLHLLNPLRLRLHPLRLRLHPLRLRLHPLRLRLHLLRLRLHPLRLRLHPLRLRLHPLRLRLHPLRLRSGRLDHRLRLTVAPCFCFAVTIACV